jgi:hypothetical protein
MRRALLLPLFLFACSEYELSGKEDPDPGDDDDPGVTDGEDGATDGTEVVAEECNGVDDDDDGEVDEGFPDTDLDGVADCVDEDCEVDAPTATDAVVDEDCLAPDIVITDPWNVAIEWQHTVSGSSSGVIVMPAVGNLTDDNGDGVVDDADSPDIVFTTWGDHKLVALHGDGSGTIFEKSGYDGNAGVAIADVDNDGTPEIVAATTDRRVAAIDGTGSEEWRSAQSYSWQYYPQPVVADLEGDGDVEIVFDVAVVEGASGAHVATLAGVTSSWRAPVVADLDADGTQEILLAEIVYDHTGAKEWSVSRVGDSTFAAVGDIDGDIGGESFWVTGSTMYVVDDDGTVLRTVALNSACFRPGPPSVADFDGDGDIEVAVPASQKLEMFDPDGTRLWQVTVQDYSGIAGVSGYDVNADGVYEVLYADETHLRIFDGATGAVRYENPSHSSGTLWEYPVVADVDGDESAEIVIASNGSPWRGITVFGHDGDGWAKSGATWPVHDFAVTNINADGSVPSPAPLPWSVYNVFRARPTVDDAAVDLAVEIVDVCFAGCAGESSVEVSVQVSNLGGIDSDPGVQVALYSVEAGVETLVEVQALALAVPTGRTTDAVIFSLTRDQVGSDGLVVRVDDDGAAAGVQTECDESNNEDTYSEWPC